MGAPSDAWATTVTAASPWAVDLALILVAVAAALAVLGGLGAAVAMKAREMLGAGATPRQVKSILDEKINGGLERIERKLDALDAKVDGDREDSWRMHRENGERLAALETLNSMAETGSAHTRWDGRERRKSPR